MAASPPSKLQREREREVGTESKGERKGSLEFCKPETDIYDFVYIGFLFYFYIIIIILLAHAWIMG